MAFLESDKIIKENLEDEKRKERKETERRQRDTTSRKDGENQNGKGKCADLNGKNARTEKQKLSVAIWYPSHLIIPSLLCFVSSTWPPLNHLASQFLNSIDFVRITIIFLNFGLRKFC